MKPVPKPMHYCLIVLSWMYAGAAALRAFLYAAGVFSVRHLPRPVICVGNVTAGGTGKTSAVVLLARFFEKAGKKPVILIRGYRRNNKKPLILYGNRDQYSAVEEGDEPVLLAEKLPHVPVGVGANRYRTGIAACLSYAADLFIMDDGFQHLRLARDLNILLIDCDDPWGGGQMLPAGYLREPLNALKRADMIILTHTNQVPEDQKKDVSTVIRRVHPLVPVLESVHHPVHLERMDKGQSYDIAFLNGKKVSVFTGTGNPDSFFESVKSLHADIIQSRVFPDHHQFTAQELEELYAAAQKEKCSVITTEKDAVRIRGKVDCARSFMVLGVELVITEGRQLLDDILKKLIA